MKVYGEKTQTCTAQIHMQLRKIFREDGNFSLNFALQPHSHKFLFRAEGRLNRATKIEVFCAYSVRFVRFVTTETTDDVRTEN